MSFPAYSRGASLLGVLMLVGILSSVAVITDSQFVAQEKQKSQLASLAIAGPTKPPTTTAPPQESSSKPEPGTQTIKCVMGYDYAVYEENNKTYLTCKHTKQCNSNRIPQVSGTDKDGNPIPSSCPPTPEKYATKMLTTADRADQCSAIRSLWKCKYYHCSEAYAKEGGCKLMGEKAEGESMDSKKVISQAAQDATQSDLPRLLQQGDTQRLEKVKTGESSFSSALNDAWSEKVKKDEVAVRNAESQLKEMELLANRGACQPPLCNLEEANKKVAEAQAQLAVSKEGLELLAKNQVSLTSTSQSNGLKELWDKCPPEGCFQPKNPGNTFEQGPGSSGQQKQGCGAWDFLCRNTNQPDEQDRYCVVRLEPIVVEQYPARPGCYNYRPGASGGYGAYGGYPGQGQSSRCGGQQGNFGGGLGGIIGGIVSLFTRNSGGNSNCTPDGVPKPQCTLTASPSNISTPGQQVTLSWQSDDAFSANLSSNGSVGVNGSQTVQPQQTTTYTLSLQGYRNTQTGQVLTGQCSTQVTVGGTTTPSGTGPKAQISCSPQTADVGMSVAVSYSCLNSNTSSGTGFSTNNQLSGSATPVVTNPTIGSNSVTYGLTCSKDGKTDSAQCTVQVNKTALVLVANPKNVKRGEEANIGWVTSGMQSCTISSPQLADFTRDNAGVTNVSGVVRTPPLTEDATFVLTCTSRSGGTKTAETKVEVD